jgi:hypothetical protein
MEHSNLNKNGEGEYECWEIKMAKHLKMGFSDNNDLTDEDYNEIIKRFKKNPEICGRDEMNEIMDQNCRHFETRVHISMLLLTSTMVWDGEEIEVPSDPESLDPKLWDPNLFKCFCISNMRVNHNNPSKIVFMAMNPLNIAKKNTNNNTSWGKDMEVCMMRWNKVRTIHFRFRVNLYHTIFIYKGLTHVYTVSISFRGTTKE